MLRQFLQGQGALRRFLSDESRCETDYLRFLWDSFGESEFTVAEVKAKSVADYGSEAWLDPAAEGKDKKPGEDQPFSSMGISHRLRKLLDVTRAVADGVQVKLALVGSGDSGRMSYRLVRMDGGDVDG